MYPVGCQNNGTKMIFREKKAQKKKKVSEISAARRITDEYLKILDFEAFKSN